MGERKYRIEFIAYSGKKLEFKIPYEKDINLSMNTEKLEEIIKKQLKKRGFKNYKILKVYNYNNNILLNYEKNNI